MIGASIYLSGLDAKYLELVKSKEVSYFFTSLHIQEEKFDKEKLNQILDLQKTGDIVVDVSPKTLEMLEINDIFELKNFGIKVIRLDYGFDDFDLIKRLSEQFRIVFNASIIDEEFVEKLYANDIDPTKLLAMHNFYPKINSALDSDNFILKNKMLNKHKITVMAFVPGDTSNRLPTYEGLPTLEEHRGANQYCSAIELIKEMFVNIVFIGDGNASEYLLEKLEEAHNHEDYIEVRCTLKEAYQHLYGQKISIRKDSNKNSVRLNSRHEILVPQNDVKSRVSGHIGVTNELYGRYNGEIEIAANDLGFDARVNTMGYVYVEDLCLLKHLRNTRHVIFKKA